MQSTKNQQLHTAWAIALMSFVAASAISPVAPTVAIAYPLLNLSTTAQLNPSQVSSPQLPRRVARRVRQDLAQRLNVDWRNLQVVHSSRETWPDSCLGLAAPNQRCAMATVDGWRIEISDAHQRWIYRTDLDAQVIKLEDDRTGLPPEVVERVFEAIAQQARVPANTLKVVEAQPRTWDGCMGIFEPGQACTQIAISGYRVIVMGDRQSWVYHTDQNGSQIVQNSTASGSGVQITPSFMPAEAQPPMPAENVVFQMTVTGGLQGNTEDVFLTSDGTIYRRRTGRQASDLTVVKRISQRQLRRFQQGLEQQKFPNLHGMRYVTPVVVADYPTTIVQAMGSSVAYVDLEYRNLPRSLQTILRNWERL